MPEGSVAERLQALKDEAVADYGVKSGLWKKAQAEEADRKAELQASVVTASDLQVPSEQIAKQTGVPKTTVDKWVRDARRERGETKRRSPRKSTAKKSTPKT